jgi:hypothetical protein
MNIDPDLLDDDLSSAMGTKMLLTYDLVPDGLPVSSKGACRTAGTPYQRNKIPGSRLKHELASRFEGMKDLVIWNRAARFG